MFRRLFFALIFVLLLVTGCLSSGPLPEWEQQTHPIINGAPDLSHPAVGALTVGTSSPFCTATLITPQLVLTAAHCVDAISRYGGVSRIRFRTDQPNGSSFTPTHHSLQAAHKHPSYSRQTGPNYDIAVVVLKQKANGITPIPINETKMDASWIGRQVKVMGYGLIQTQPSVRRPTQKYAADIPIYQVTSNYFIHYDQQTKKSACHGDSGGPALYTVNGKLSVLGVTSIAYKATRNPAGNPATFCDGGTVDCRTDARLSFLRPYLQKYGGTPSCQDGTTQACYTGPAGTENVGPCKGGTQTCTGGSWSACTGEVTPAAKDSCDGQDNDCDGQTDEDCPQQCTDGQQRSCYTGPAGTQGVGACREGTQTCYGGQWKPCLGDVVPAPQEICHDQLDNNCDGQTDEGCPECQQGDSRPCYTGPNNTAGIGNCKMGSQTCSGGIWGACKGQVLPVSKEICGDGQDNDCNGQTDEGCTPSCTEGQSETCYTDSPSTLNIGICKAGQRTCRQHVWSSCEGEVTPQAKETCGDGLDNNCDGKTDEGCSTTGACTTGQQIPCYTGPANTHKQGICKLGVRTCKAGQWTACIGEVTPQPQEICKDGLDNNCNGEIDENCSKQNPKDLNNLGLRPRGCGCQTSSRRNPPVFWLGGLFCWLLLLSWRRR